MQHLPPPDPEANAVLFKHPDPTQEDRAGEVRLEHDEETGHPARLIVTTHWRPDDGERKALTNGAMVEVHTIGSPLDPEIPSRQQVPQVGTFVVGVGAPPERGLPGGPRALYDQGHVERALGHLYGQLRGASGSIEWVDGSGIVQVSPASDFLLRWQDALEETRVVNTDGPSIADLALPADVREEL